MTTPTVWKFNSAEVATEEEAKRREHFSLDVSLISRLVQKNFEVSPISLEWLNSRD
jgi:hypothetical protein